MREGEQPRNNSELSLPHTSASPPLVPRPLATTENRRKAPAPAGVRPLHTRPSQELSATRATDVGQRYSSVSIKRQPLRNAKPKPIRRREGTLHPTLPRKPRTDWLKTC